MKRILAFVSITLTLVAGTVSCNNDPKADGVAQITSFSLQSSLNSNLSSNVDGVIDEQAKTISLVLPEGSGSSFIPTFTVTDDDVVKAGATVVTSGVTSISVTDGAKLSVTDEVSELNVAYTLSVKENDGAAELKSVSFLKADNSVLTADVTPEAIASEMVVRVPSAAFKQELTLTVEAGLNDIVKVNGKETSDGKIKVDTSFPIDITVTDEVAKTTASYTLKVGKVLEYVVTKVGTITDGTKIFGNIALAINPKDGKPWIAYSKEIEGDKIDRVAVQKFDGTSFSYVGESYITPNPDSKDAKDPTLAFSADGTAYLKYYGGEASSRNTIWKFGSSWEVVGKASVNSVNASSTYDAPLYIQSNGHPAFFFTGNTKKSTDSYRTIVAEYFDGSEWVEKVAAASGIAPKYGEPTSKDGMFYAAVYTEHKGKTYMLATFNQWGYCLYEVGDKCALTPVVYDYKPSSSEYGLPGNHSIASNGENLFVFAADKSAGKMQVYKVDTPAKTLSEYGEGLAVNIASNGGITEDASFSVSQEGLMVVATSDKDNNTSFKFMNSNLQWEDFTVSEKPRSIASAGKYRIAFDANGNGYIAYPGETGDTKTGNIEVYKVALEADILPE